MEYLFELREKEREIKVSELGGKGANLVKLTRGGFQIPGGFVIKSSAFDVFVKECSLDEIFDDEMKDIEEKCELIHSRMDETLLSPPLQDAIETLLKSVVSTSILKSPLFAVRSSGVTEDLDEASFAGMNDTILNVNADVVSICNAMKACWKSLYSKRSISYRNENGYPAYKTSIAVIVQVMIPSDSSGVAFSADPQSNSRGVLSLDGVQGLGEALVSGMVNTDHWLIRKSYGKRKMKILEESIGYQEFKLLSNYPEKGTRRAELSEEEGKESCFTKDEIKEIARVVCDIEMYYTKEIDIEFCFYQHQLYIVQARPITHLLMIPDILNPLYNKKNPVWGSWVSFNCLQMLDVPISPCGVSAFMYLMGVSEKYLQSVNGYMYLNTAGVMKVGLVRKVFMKIVRNMVDKEMGNILRDIYKKDYKYYKKTVSYAPFRTLFRLYYKNLIKTLLGHIIKRSSEETLRNIANKSFKENMERIESFIESVRKGKSFDEIPPELFPSKTLILTIFPAIFFSLVTGNKIKKITRKYGLEDLDVEKMWSKSKENIAYQMNNEMMRMSIVMKEMKENEEMRYCIDNICVNKRKEDAESFITSLSTSTNEKEKEFYSLWIAFMKRFGRRGPVEIDIMTPRYEDNIVLVIGMINNLDTTGYKTVEEDEKELEDETERILSKLSLKDQKKVRSLLPVARIMLAYRESPKYIMVSCIYAIRVGVMEQGKQMKEEGIIEDVNDVFFLSIDEIREYSHTKNGNGIKEKIEERKKIRENGMSMNPPRVIEGPECMMYYVSDETKKELLSLPSNMLKGMPTSGGIYEGTAVVATDPDTTILHKGEILVAKATDPGWTPLFVPAGAVVIEIGGPLTHGSVVAREMAIPCVVNIQGLLEKIKSGMKIRVDGYKGIIEILDSLEAVE